MTPRPPPVGSLSHDMEALSRLDRRIGARMRGAAAAVPGAPAAARALAATMSPGFRIAVAAMILRRPTRVAGLRALAAGAGASLLTRALRDRVGRSRPGSRPDGGFPSRHAAAASAIAATAGRGGAPLGYVLGAAACGGAVARVVAAEHEPADVLAGAALGLAAAAALRRIAPERVG